MINVHHPAGQAFTLVLLSTPDRLLLITDILKCTRCSFTERHLKKEGISIIHAFDMRISWWLNYTMDFGVKAIDRRKQHNDINTITFSCKVHDIVMLPHWHSVIKPSLSSFNPYCLSGPIRYRGFFSTLSCWRRMFWTNILHIIILYISIYYI